MLSYLRALVPGQRQPRLPRQTRHHRQRRDTQLLGAVPVGQVDQPHPAGPLDQGVDRRATDPGDDVSNSPSNFIARPNRSAARLRRCRERRFTPAATSRPPINQPDVTLAPTRTKSHCHPSTPEMTGGLESTGYILLEPSLHPTSVQVLTPRLSTLICPEASRS